MSDTFQIVDKIDAAPTVLLDLNDGTTWKVLQKPVPDLSPPPLKKVRIATLLADGSDIPASAYENRWLRFRARVTAASPDALATEIQKLNRQLNKETFIIIYQPTGATSPVFFRCKRSADWNRATYEPQAAASLDLAIEAEPFAYGLRVTLSPITVNNDPAAGSNPCYFDVTGVTGDVPTPAFIDLNPSGTAGTLTFTLGSRRHGTPGGVYGYQAESQSQGTDTSVQANDATASGAGSNWSRTTFATQPGMFTRLTIPLFPASGDSIDYRGIYRVFARVRKPTSGDVVDMRMFVGGASGFPVGTMRRIEGVMASSFVWFDLGLLALPVSIDDPLFEGYSNVVQEIGAISLEFQAQRVSGSGNFDWDCLLALPADEEFCVVQSRVGPSENTILDGPLDKVYNRTNTGNLPIQSDTTTQSQTQRAGSIPLLSPNQTNRIALLTNDGIAGTVVVTVSFWPRYLTIRPAST